MNKVQSNTLPRAKSFHLTPREATKEMKACFLCKTEDTVFCEFLYVQTRDLLHLHIGEMDPLTDMLGSKS